MEILSHSGVYSFQAAQFLPVNLKDAWQFFSTPTNLQRLTPDDLDFRITSPHLDSIHQGQIITYSIKIFPLIRSQWVTEITSVEHEKMFVDEQRYGPYKMWHHKHSFREVEGGVEMIDHVHFKLPFAPLAPIAYRLFIRKKLMNIFEFRREALEKMIKNNELK